MKSFLYTLFLLCFSTSLFSQVEEEEYEPLSKPSNPDVYAQEDGESESGDQGLATVDSQSWKQRMLYGGNVQMQFGTYTIIELSPRAGYRVTDHFTSGLGVNYLYFRYSNNFPVSSLAGTDFTIYGAHAFATYHFDDFLPLAAHVEFEMLNAPFLDPSTGEYPREWLPSLYLGPAYVQRLSSGGGIYLMA